MGSNGRHEKTKSCEYRSINMHQNTFKIFNSNMKNTNKTATNLKAKQFL